MKVLSVLLLLLVASTFAEKLYKEFSELTAEELRELPPIVFQRLSERYSRRFEDDIVGGVEVNPKYKYPWMTDLYYTSGGHFCGGSLINSSWVLTAAHCSTGMNPRNVGIQVHRHNLAASSASESGVSRTISQIIVHPRYNPLTINNDVALWKLSSPITNIETVPLDVDGSYSPAGVTSTVIGWGATREGGAGSNILLEVDVPILTNTKCNTQYGGGITDSMICAGFDAGGKDSCQGDSGGPLFVNKNSKPIQIGVVSWGQGCARPGYPGVYARVSELYDFIADTIGL